MLIPSGHSATAARQRAKSNYFIYIPFMKKLVALLGALLLFAIACQAQPLYTYSDTIVMQPGEKWFGGAVDDGTAMPFAPGYHLDLYGNNKGNQACPLLLSTNGRFIWSEQPFSFTVLDHALVIKGITEPTIQQRGHTLASAFQSAGNRYFPPSGKLPDTLLFSRPQYNTWIELMYNQNQKDILAYAHAILDHGFPPGVLMIDDNWAPYYGRFEFRSDRFANAKEMIFQLHSMGFKVMVWVCPFIRADSEEFRYLQQQRFLLFDNRGDAALTWKDAREPALIHWWNGYSAEMDFTNPGAVNWYRSQLQSMQTVYGVDGFKFDAGDMEFYPSTSIPFKKATPNEQCEAWGQFGLLFPLNEYRAMWKRGGLPLAERLRDKQHTWQDLQKLIPNLTTEGLAGYPFACPDMIGGGEFTSFIGREQLDQDLVVRSAQCSALMPMMQFSAAPWRVLDAPHLDAVKKVVALRTRMTPYIMQLAKEAAITGEPIVRRMEYVFPGQRLEACRDQFMLGERLMVAPMVEKGPERKVIFPKGRWKDEKGNVIRGPLVRAYTVPIDCLLWFEKIGN